MKIIDRIRLRFMRIDVFDIIKEVYHTYCREYKNVKGYDKFLCPRFSNTIENYIKDNYNVIVHINCLLIYLYIPEFNYNNPKLEIEEHKSEYSGWWDTNHDNKRLNALIYLMTYYRNHKHYIRYKDIKYDIL